MDSSTPEPFDYLEVKQAEIGDTGDDDQQANVVAPVDGDAVGRVINYGRQQISVVEGG